MELIYADTNGSEIGFLTDFNLDLDIGSTNDFEISTVAKKKIMDFGYSVYADETEYGGIISKVEVNTELNKIAYSGQTWRGILNNYIISPPPGEDYKIVSGNVSTIISGLISDFGIGSLYSVAASEIAVTNYQFDRYCTLLSGVEKMLKSVGYRLNISCQNGAVTLTPTPIHDYSDELEYSQDSNINFRIQDNQNGVNHLVCLGQGDLRDRQVLNLYLLADGTIGTTQYYTGLSERADVFDFPAVESLDELEKFGRERFALLLNSQKMEMTIGDIAVELGDIVGGRERITGIYMKKPITQKIVKGDAYSMKISYKVG